MRKHARLRSLAPMVRTLDIDIAKRAEKTADPIYATAEYRAWRDAVIARAGHRCQDPTHDVSVPSTGKLVADHVVELRDGGAAFDLANGMARCWPCHSKKTIAERAARMAR